MQRTLFTCLWLLIICVAGKAQFNLPLLTEDSGKIYFRALPLALLDMGDNYISVGAEYRFNMRWAATVDAGYIFYSKYYGKAKSASGIVLRPAIRYYTGQYKDYFIDLQLHYKNVRYHIEDWLGRQVVNGVPAYDEHTRFGYHKQEVGVQLVGGVKRQISNNHRWHLELYLGLGVHFKWQHIYDQPNSKYITQNTTMGTADGYNITAAVPAGIRLIYRLRP